MRLRTRILAGAMLVAAGYAASPYITLWQLYENVSADDVQALADGVDWQTVREGLKADITEGIVGIPATQLVSRNLLPAFGASFMSGIASGFIERAVNPPQVLAAVQALRQGETLKNIAGGTAPSGTMDYAFFRSPTIFLVQLHAPGQYPDEPPVRLQMELEGWHWRVTRAWVPQDLIDRVHFHT